MKLSIRAKYSAELMRRGQNGVANAMFLCLMSSVFFKKYIKKPLQAFLWQVLMSLVVRLASGSEE